MPSQELLEDIFHLSLMMENVRFDHSFVVLRECHQGYIVVSLQFDTVLQFDAAGLLVFAKIMSNRTVRFCEASLSHR